MSDLRAKIEAALQKPVSDQDFVTDDHFDPWADVITGIHGCYSSECDDLMISALKAVRDHRIFEFMDVHGLSGELALYILSGHGLTEYGTSPRGGWPAPEIADLWDRLISKWEEYRAAQWPASQED